MDKRKIIALIVLSIAVIGFSMGAISAKTVTVKMEKAKHVGHGDYVGTFYQKNDAKYPKGTYVYALYYSKNRADYGPHTYRLTKAKIYFKNKKGKVITKTLYSKKTYQYRLLYKKKIKGYTPYKSKITYRKMTKAEKKKNKKYIEKYS
ncbi:hypothetical protein [Methanobrevibacter olleyae]|uniref:Adhesin-like protein n=1 Tax=Methanobrevibacter olleyae TaxID=294671 RepID=A0A126QZX2_METOL|nr:hypothetical protein [Methanobrevibacter olleyae]AMK15374.1 hypothetical protein YLM1_0817 [Methanobrevibacter olleyae]SFL49259.1 hypothetical protein SAMN02910297_01044 [Methanobrevibacter olleyae]